MDSEDSTDVGALGMEEVLPGGQETPDGGIAITYTGVTASSDRSYTTSVSEAATLTDHMLAGRTALQLGDTLPTQKATLIVVHTDGTLMETAGLKPPIQTLTCSITKESSKYQWDQSAYENELPVRCRNTSGILSKSRIGSGGRGKCVRHNEMWYTPNEFEAMAGRANSKDWKRSIRYGGRPLQCLIKDGILNPHAASCTCAACCDDMTLSGPIKLFVPYKRRKKEHELNCHSMFKKEETKSISLLPSTSNTAYTIGSAVTMMATGSLSFERDVAADAPTTPILTDATSQADVFNATAVLSPLPPLSAVSPTPDKGLSPGSSLVELDSPHRGPIRMAPQQQQLEHQRSENHHQQSKHWVHLEDMVTSLISTAQQLKALLEVAKQASVGNTAMAGLSSCTERSSEEQTCANCGREAMNECTGCHKIHYCSTFCQQKLFHAPWNMRQNVCPCFLAFQQDWKEHQQVCGNQIEETLIASPEDEHLTEDFKQLPC
uniref:deformed epidermal autoregulatory factor 1 homolog isoform X2 n=1 Tax=Myxine glutinosa TaxID=7769 RepID=UPI00358EB469